MAARPAIEDLVPLYYEALYRYAYRLTGSSSDADDLVQETFVTAQAKIQQLRDPDKVRSWLFSILHNAFLLHQRHQRKVYSLSWENGLEQEIVSRVIEPPLITEDQLQQALLSIPPDYRAILVLYYFEEYSYRELAEQLKLPLGTVMSRLSRAREHLRKKLLHHRDDYHDDTSQNADDNHISGKKPVNKPVDKELS
ncbi:MAG TPA: RNA polymerase sigma factor [Gemmatales bacterium]|nr:RNA polymerase sigma factor [Gemmatales bacterium]